MTTPIETVVTLGSHFLFARFEQARDRGELTVLNNLNGNFPIFHVFLLASLPSPNWSAGTFLELLLALLILVIGGLPHIWVDTAVKT